MPTTDYVYFNFWMTSPSLLKHEYLYIYLYFLIPFITRVLLVTKSEIEQNPHRETTTTTTTATIEDDTKQA